MRETESEKLCMKPQSKQTARWVKKKICRLQRCIFYSKNYTGDCISSVLLTSKGGEKQRLPLSINILHPTLLIPPSLFTLPFYSHTLYSTQLFTTSPPHFILLNYPTHPVFTPSTHTYSLLPPSIIPPNYPICHIPNYHKLPN